MKYINPDRVLSAEILDTGFEHTEDVWNLRLECEGHDGKIVPLSIYKRTKSECIGICNALGLVLLEK